MIILAWKIPESNVKIWFWRHKGLNDSVMTIDGQLQSIEEPIEEMLWMSDIFS